MFLKEDFSASYRPHTANKIHDKYSIYHSGPLDWAQHSVDVGLMVLLHDNPSSSKCYCFVHSSRKPLPLPPSHWARSAPEWHGIQSHTGCPGVSASHQSISANTKAQETQMHSSYRMWEINSDLYRVHLPAASCTGFLTCSASQSNSASMAGSSESVGVTR